MFNPEGKNLGRKTIKNLNFPNQINSSKSNTMFSKKHESTISVLEKVL